MTPSETKWLRVNRERPCPVCGKADWCLVADDTAPCICPRTESPKRCGDAGFLHKLTDAPPRVRWRLRFTDPHRVARPDDARHQYKDAATADRLRRFGGFDVEPESLTAFGVGWAADHLAWSFPMTDPRPAR